MRLALTYNVKRKKYGFVSLEFDSPQTIRAIKDALEEGGNEVALVEADEEVFWNLKRLRNKKTIDFVFNIAEGIRGESRESHLPAILEMLDLPYSGSGPLAQAITLNKVATKKILAYHHIPIANFQMVEEEDFDLEPQLNLPLIVKPNEAGSSIGIFNHSVCLTKRAVKRCVLDILTNYHQPALIEEYLTGREFTVALLGNEKPRVLPIVEINFDALPSGSRPIDSYEAKWIWDDPENPLEILFCPAKIDKKLEQQIEKICLEAFGVLNLKDFARVDIRLNSQNEPYILEINALPGLIADPQENSRFPRAAAQAGLTYNQMINEILKSALKRYNLLELLNSDNGHPLSENECPKNAKEN